MFPNVVVVVVDVVVVVVVGCGEDRRLVCLEVLENPRACHWYHLRKKLCRKNTKKFEMCDTAAC